MSLSVISTLGKFSTEKKTMVVQEENVGQFLFLLLLLFSCPVKPDSLWMHHGLQHTRPLCPSRSPEVCPGSCPMLWWCHLAISSFDTLFSSALNPSQHQGLFYESALCIRCQITGASASALVLPTNIQGWFPLRLIGWISLLSKGLSVVFSSTIVQRHQFFSPLPSLQSSSHNHAWPLGKP